METIEDRYEDRPLCRECEFPISPGQAAHSSTPGYHNACAPPGPCPRCNKPATKRDLIRAREGGGRIHYLCLTATEKKRFDREQGENDRANERAERES